MAMANANANANDSHCMTLDRISNDPLYRWILGKKTEMKNKRKKKLEEKRIRLMDMCLEYLIFFLMLSNI